MKKRNRLIMGSAIGLASIAIAIDHTNHQLPEPEENSAYQQAHDDDDESPCSMSSPCAMDDSPCSLDLSPCNLDD